jgi:hypothetical protein
VSYQWAQSGSPYRAGHRVCVSLAQNRISTWRVSERPKSISSTPKNLYYPFLSTSQCIPIWAPGAFTSAAGKPGRGPGGEKFFAKCFWIGPCSKFSLAAKNFLRSHNCCLLVREMISSGPAERIPALPIHVCSRQYGPVIRTCRHLLYLYEVP